MTKDTEALRGVITGVRAWVAALTVTDMNEIVADGGITAGMVVGQEAGEQLRRLDAALATPASDVAPVVFDMRTAMKSAVAQARSDGARDKDIIIHWLAYNYLEQYLPPLYAHQPLAQSVDPVAGEAMREKVARIIAAGNHGDPWWWKEAFDDGSDEIAARNRADDVSVADDILAALQGPAA